MKEVDVSIDRVSVVGKCSDPTEFMSWMDAQTRHTVKGLDKRGEIVRHEVDRHGEIIDATEGRTRYKPLPGIRLPRQGADNPLVKFQWVSDDGVHVSMVCEDRGKLTERWVPLWGDSANGGAAFRLEWNPNKNAPGPLLWFMDAPRATRLDVALDYEGYDLADWSFSRPRVAASRFYDRYAGVEGIMLGRRRSDRHCVIYDKRAEIASKMPKELRDTVDLGDDLMRFEMRQSIGPADERLPERLFDGVTALRSRVPSDVKPTEAAYLALLIHEPSIFGGLDPKTQRKYREIAADGAETLAPHPEQVYRSALPELREKVAAIIDGQPVPVARVYERLTPSDDRASKGVEVASGGIQARHRPATHSVKG